MPGLEEGQTVWRYRIADPGKFDRMKVKEIGSGGVKITLGRVKGTSRWEIQNYMFEKTRFKTREQVLGWLEKYHKSNAQSVLDFKAWNEWRRRVLNAYLQISHVE